ncbi:MAG: hypothetical protein V3V75_00345 [Thermoguttaceae bacterium]
MAKRGRKPVLDRIKRREIIAILSVGCSRRTAAKYVGCAVSTIQNTADRDADFAKQLREADCKTEIGFLKNIKEAANKAQYWRAAAWALERKNPQEFAARSPEVITIEQISHLLSQFAEIIVEEVPAAKTRKSIIKRLDTLTRSLHKSKGADDE